MTDNNTDGVAWIDSRNRHLFGGNREKAIQRDGGRCVKCGVTRQEHKEKHGRDITVDHIDGNGCNTPAGQKNNKLDNLQTLCLPCHARKDSFAKKLTEESVRRIKELLSEGISQRKIAKEYGVNQSIICTINTGKAWVHV